MPVQNIIIPESMILEIDSADNTGIATQSNHVLGHFGHFSATKGTYSNVKGTIRVIKDQCRQVIERMAMLVSETPEGHGVLDSDIVAAVEKVTTLTRRTQILIDEKWTSVMRTVDMERERKMAAIQASCQAMNSQTWGSAWGRVQIALLHARCANYERGATRRCCSDYQRLEDLHTKTMATIAKLLPDF